MAKIADEIRKQIEAAYDFRGHVSVTLVGGESVTGYLFNREYENPRMKEDCFIELMVKDSGERRRYPMARISSIALTGEDHAAGKSYEDYLKKKAAQSGS